jgi:hypothetical protein
MDYMERRGRGSMQGVWMVGALVGQYKLQAVCRENTKHYQKRMAAFTYLKKNYLKQHFFEKIL